MTKAELENILARLDECINGKSGLVYRLDSIDQKLAVSNGNMTAAVRELSEAKIVLAKTESLAIEAHDKAKNNTRWIWGLAIAVIGALATIIYVANVVR